MINGDVKYMITGGSYVFFEKYLSAWSSFTGNHITLPCDVDISPLETKVDSEYVETDITLDMLGAAKADNGQIMWATMLPSSSPTALNLEYNGPLGRLMGLPYNYVTTKRTSYFSGGPVFAEWNHNKTTVKYIPSSGSPSEETGECYVLWPEKGPAPFMGVIKKSTYWFTDTGSDTTDYGIIGVKPDTLTYYLSDAITTDKKAYFQTFISTQIPYGDYASNPYVGENKVLRGADGKAMAVPEYTAKIMVFDKTTDTLFEVYVYDSSGTKQEISWKRLVSITDSIKAADAAQYNCKLYITGIEDAMLVIYKNGYIVARVPMQLNLDGISLTGPITPTYLLSIPLGTCFSASALGGSGTLSAEGGTKATEWQLCSGPVISGSSGDFDAMLSGQYNYFGVIYKSGNDNQTNIYDIRKDSSETDKIKSGSFATIYSTLGDLAVPVMPTMAWIDSYDSATSRYLVSGTIQYDGVSGAGAFNKAVMCVKVTPPLGGTVYGTFNE